jgi:hypothetical protein
MSSAISPPMKKNAKACDDVHHADHLVIGGRHQLVEQRALGTQPGRKGVPGLQFSD